MGIIEGKKKYEITGYKVYECPKSPTEKGLYYGKTPILEQAEGIIKRAKESGKHLFLKAVCSDGIERYMF